MIDQAMKVRKQKIEEKQDLMVDVRPEFAAALSQSFSFSSKLPFPLTHCRAERHECEPDEAWDQEKEDQGGDGGGEAFKGRGEKGTGVHQIFQEEDGAGPGAKGLDYSRVEPLLTGALQSLRGGLRRQGGAAHWQEAGAQHCDERGHGVMPSSQCEDFL